MEATRILEVLQVEQAKAKELEKKRMNAIREKGKALGDKIKWQIDRSFCEVVSEVRTQRWR